VLLPPPPPNGLTRLFLPQSPAAAAKPGATPAASAAAKGVDAVAALLVAAKIPADNAKRYAAALAKEGYDAPEKLPLLDEADLVACGVTTRFDIKTILALKATMSAAPAVVAAATAAPVGVSKPAATAAPVGVSKPAATAAPVGVNKSAAAAVGTKPAAAAAAAGGIKPSPAKPVVSPVAAAANGDKKASPFGPSVGGGGADKRKKEEEDAEKRRAMVMALVAPVKAIEKKPPGKR
jgi:hypothetical protein